MNIARDFGTEHLYLSHVTQQNIPQLKFVYYIRHTNNLIIYVIIWFFYEQYKTIKNIENLTRNIYCKFDKKKCICIWQIQNQFIKINFEQ